MSAPEESQALLSGAPFATAVAAVNPKQDLQRSWRFPLWRVVGNGSPEDIVSLGLACHFPYLAFGWNTHRTLQVSFWRELIKILAVLVGTWLILSISAHLLFFSCAGWPEPGPHDMHKPFGKQGMGSAAMDPHAMDADDHDHRHHDCDLFRAVHDLPAECRAGVIGGFSVILVTAIAVFVAAVVYAAKRRQQIREQFGIEGTFRGDLLSWMFCAPCALAQETRTLMTNQVHEGVWYGPLVNNANCAPVTQQMV